MAYSYPPYMTPPPMQVGVLSELSKPKNKKVEKAKKKKAKKSKHEKSIEEIIAFNSNPQHYMGNGILQGDNSYPLKSFIQNRQQELAIESMDEIDREIYGIQDNLNDNHDYDGFNLEDFGSYGETDVEETNNAANPKQEFYAPKDEYSTIENWNPGDKLVFKGMKLDEVEASFIMSNKMADAKILHPIFADVLEGDKVIYGYKFLEKYPILHHITDEETVKYFLHGASKKAGLIEGDLTLEQELQCANDNNIVLHLNGADISYERYGYDYANDFPALSLAELVMAEYNIGLIEPPRGLKPSEKITDKMDLFCKFKPTLTEDEQKQVIGMAYYTRAECHIASLKVKYNNRILNLWLSRFAEDESTYLNDYPCNYIYEQYWIDVKYKDFIYSPEAKNLEVIKFGQTPYVPKEDDNANQ